MVSFNTPFNFKFNRDSYCYLSTHKLENCLNRNDFRSIIFDPKLFWITYCKSFLDNKLECGENFRIGTSCRNVVFLKNEIITKKIRTMIETIRKICVKGLDQTVFEIYINDTVLPGQWEFEKEERSSDEIESQNTQIEETCHLEIDAASAPWYNKWVKPVLPRLLNSCGADYHSEYIKKTIKIVHKMLPLYKMNKDFIQAVLRVTWKKNCDIVYPSPCKIIPEQVEHEEIRSNLYHLYKKQEQCDFTLLSKDTAINVHSDIFHLCESGALKQLFSSKEKGYKELIDKTISFKYYSHSTLESFVEWAYLGGRAFIKKIASGNDQNEIDLIELFEFAHANHITNLIDCCTNLIILTATMQDFGTIKKMIEVYGKFYETFRLEQLCEHLSAKEKLLEAKSTICQLIPFQPDSTSQATGQKKDANDLEELLFELLVDLRNKSLDDLTLACVKVQDAVDIRCKNRESLLKENVAKVAKDMSASTRKSLENGIGDAVTLIRKRENEKLLKSIYAFYHDLAAISEDQTTLYFSHKKEPLIQAYNQGMGSCLYYVHSELQRTKKLIEEMGTNEPLYEILKDLFSTL